MKKAILFFLILMSAALLLGCTQKNEPTEESAQIGNPWIEYSSMEEAEAAAGFSLDMPAEIGSFRAEEFRVMNGEMLEVVYYDGIYEVTARKAKSAEEDISGVYAEYDAVTQDDSYGIPVTWKRSGDICTILFSLDGYSHSLYAPDGFAGDQADDFLRAAIN